MATTYDVLHGLLEDARKYEMLAKKAERHLALRSPSVVPNNELVGLLREIARLSHSQSFEAKRLLTQQFSRQQYSTTLEVAAKPEGEDASVPSAFLI
jgi:hypothetical protein